VRFGVLIVLAAALLVPVANARDAKVAARTPVASFCSASGDVCIGITKTGTTIFLEIATVEKFFASYRLCVKGPKTRVCKSFLIRKSGQGYASNVRWNGTFPNQGHGVYRVTWSASAKTLIFRR
jgi:hypothetical protein